MDELEPTIPNEASSEQGTSVRTPIDEGRERPGAPTVNVYNAPQYQNNGQIGAMGDSARSIHGASAASEHSEEAGYRSADRLTFAKFQQLLTREGSMRFVEENNFAGFSFQNTNMHEIWKFLNETRDPEFEFLDEELEQSFGALKYGLARFSDEVGTNTFPTDPGFNSVPAEFEDRYAARFWQMVNDIHSAALEATAAYVAFIRLARRKLA